MKVENGMYAMKRFPLRAAMFIWALAMISTFGSLANANDFKRIRDINISCTNALSCDLYIVNTQVTLNTIGLRRSANVDAPVSLFLKLREALVAGSSVSIDIDGAQVFELPVSDFSYRAALSEYSYAGPELVNALIGVARRGTEMRVTYRTRNGQSAAPFSLSGIVEGLLFMDEVQGRIGRDDALSSVRSNAGDQIKSNADVRELEGYPAALAAYFTGDGAMCSRFDENTPLFGGFEVTIGPNSALVALPCGEGGAYNFPYALWERVDDRYRPVPVPILADQGPSTSMLVWNAYWDSDTNALVSFFKGRGIGDCGTYQRWIWTEVLDGPALVLTEMREKGDCDGDMAGGPEQWAPLWPKT